MLEHNVIQNTLAANMVKIRQVNSTDASYPATTLERKPRLAYTGGADNQPSGNGTAAAQDANPAVVDLAKTAVVPNTQRPDTTRKAIQNLVKLSFFGTGAADNTFKARVLAWHYVVNPGADHAKETACWVPITLCEVLVTLGTMAGPGGVLSTSELFADTIAIQGTSGNDDVSIDIVSPGDNTIAHIVVDMKGAQKLEVIFDRNSSATSCNALASMY